MPNPYLYVVIVLIVALVFVGVYLGTMVNSETAKVAVLQSELSTLSANYTMLQSQYSQLQSQYNQLEKNYTDLQAQYDKLNSQYLTLQQQYVQLLNTISKCGVSVTTESAFIFGVENWLGLACIYNKYGESAALNAINNIYTIAYDYLYDYEETGNTTYLLLYPIVQYQNLTSSYPDCVVIGSIQNLTNTVTNALSSIDTAAHVLNIPGNLLGTPLFVIFNRANNITYVVAGASPVVYDAIDYAKEGRLVSTITYQGELLGIGFRASPTQVGLINELISSGLGFGNPRASLVVIEFLDPTCPFCALFQVTYGKPMQEIINNGTAYYVIQYFPTHVLGYGCSSPTIAPMLGSICQG